MSDQPSPRPSRGAHRPASLHFRAAGPGDCSDLALLADAATRRLVSWIWDGSTAAGQSSFEVGRSAMLADSEALSHYSHWRVVERAGSVVGAINSYRLEPGSGLDGKDDDVLRPLVELKSIATGTWYVSVASVFPEARGGGVGQALLVEAERIAVTAGAAWLSLVVASFNPRAKQLYERVGFHESARRVFQPFPGSDTAGEWILMVKDIAAT